MKRRGPTRQERREQRRAEWKRSELGGVETGTAAEAAEIHDQHRADIARIKDEQLRASEWRRYCAHLEQFEAAITESASQGVHK